MTTLTPAQTIHGFQVDRIQDIQEFEATAYIMHHIKTDAQLLYLDIEDDEKGFAIGFRTHPADNTGVFHILEHSVLCGSDRYPVKEPFTHLLKSSMKTFLNAATAPDFTVFPVASTNEKDLVNLMSVYLDAVFHPAILHEPRILMQEGWHYELDGETPIVNGVVYNEMKGMLADPAYVLSEEVNARLFPDTSYRFEPGGVPGEIETLTYEQFIDTYKRHYRPDNAAIVLFGKIDIDNMLSIIDGQYLAELGETPYSDLGDPNPCGTQEPVISTDGKVYLEALPQDARIQYASVFADNGDLRRLRAMYILTDALLGNPEAPLKKRLLDAGFASDFRPRIDSGGKRYLAITAKDVKPDSTQLFIDTLQEGCREILKEGIDKEALEAAMFTMKFATRTGGFQGRPDAATQMMSCIERWAAGCPLSADALTFEDDIDFLEKAIDSDYYERLMRDVLLESNHYAVVELCPISPAAGANVESGDQPAVGGVDEATLERIRKEAADLKRFQEMPDSPEALATLPQLNREDCIDAPQRQEYRIEDVSGESILRVPHDNATVAHIVRCYNISSLTLKEFQHLFVLINLISQTDTARHSAKEVLQLKNGRLGDIIANITVGTHFKDGSLQACLWVYTCSLADDIEFTSEYVDEVLHETVFADRNKLRMFVAIARQRCKAMVFDSMPQYTASTRAEAHFSLSAMLDDANRGIEGYRFTSALEEQCKDDAEADKVLRQLEIICARVFGSKPALYAFSGTDEALARFIAAEHSRIPKYEARTSEFLASLPDEERAFENQPTLAECSPITGDDEAFIIPGDCAYCSEAIDIPDAPSRMSGCWAIAWAAASLDYLWNEVRVKGGAYGASFSENKAGTAEFTSFRDPQIDGTLKSFAGLGNWLQGFDPTEKEIDGYVISAVASNDRPIKAMSRMLSDTLSYIRGWTPEDIKRRRQEIVSCTAEDVRRLGRELDEYTDAHCTVVLTSREIIEGSEHEFMVSEIECSVSGHR